MNDYTANRLIDEYFGNSRNNEVIIKPEKLVESNTKKMLEELISTISSKDPSSKYLFKAYNGWGDDPAKYLGIIRKRPSKTIFGFSKKEKLAFIRIANYYNSNYKIQISCFNPYIEEEIVKKVAELNKEEFNCKGIHIWRHGYIKNTKPSGASVREF